MPKPPPGPSWCKSPAEWGSAVGYDGWTDKWYVREGIAIHHGGGGDYPAHNPPYSQSKETQQLRSWEQYHLNKGWRGIAYNWAVGMSGTVYRLRGWNLSGAHTGDIDNDGFPNGAEILAVLFIMSGSIVAPSPAMLASFENLRAYLETENGNPLWLYGHKEVQPADPTSCPGKLNMPYIVTHRTSGEHLVNGRRIAGKDRYETAAMFAKATFDDGVPYDHVLIVSGETFPDGLAAGSAGEPILLVRKDSVPQATRDAIATLQPTSYTILGGPSVVSEAVAAELDLLIHP